MFKKALITGISGQDGFYLSELLIDKGYKVVGVTKPRSKIEHLDNRIQFEYGDITDQSFVYGVIKKHCPDEIYNLAAQSHVGDSFKTPQQTCAVNYTGYLNILLAARAIVPRSRIYQACTSEMYGYTRGVLDEKAPFQPMSPYAIAKTASYWAGVNARHEANQFVSNGIMFNHESPFRHPSFVTRKITMAVAKGLPLELGNLNSSRDWGHARDYVRGMWLTLQHDKPDDFVFATGQSTTIRDFLRMAYKTVGKEIKFDGEGLSEIGYCDKEILVTVNPYFYRPNDLDFLLGDASKANQVLGWTPTIGLKQLASEMIEADK